MPVFLLAHTVDPAVLSRLRGDLEVATVLLRTGDILTRIERLCSRAQSESDSVETGTEKHLTVAGLVGESEPFRQMIDQLRRAASSDCTVLIEGESGTGKGVCARAIRELSARADKPFRRMRQARTSDQDGLVDRAVLYPADMPGDALFQVAVFHGEKGTAYTEITLDEILEGQIVDLEVRLGEVARGTVVRSDGSPFSNARVQLNTFSPLDGVSLSGISTTTDENGSFFIPGIQFDNDLVELLVYTKGREVRRPGSGASPT